jgi:3'5'-cyclic nucleotide phosphodiesterase
MLTAAFVCINAVVSLHPTYNSGLLAAFCHDIDHTGMNNAFEINAKSDLALLHSDDSVLEKHHAHMTFKLLLQVPSVAASESFKATCFLFSVISQAQRHDMLCVQ